MKTVKECGSLFEAQVVRQRLESERIQAFVLNENSNDYVPFAGAIPSLAVQVVVADDDYERARDLLAEAMLRLRDAGLEIVMHVHDEAVLEVPIGHSGVDEVCALMAEAPAWADGLPLRADGYECRFYQKD